MPMLEGEGVAGPVVRNAPELFLKVPHVRLVNHKCLAFATEVTSISWSTLRRLCRRGRCEAFSFILGFRRAVLATATALLAPRGLVARAVQARTDIMAIQTTTVLGPETKHMCLRIDLKQFAF
jgi:hypothetical protein